MALKCSKCEKNIESAGKFGADGFTCLDYPNCKARTKEAYEIVGSFSFALEADFNAGILFRPNELAGNGYLKCETGNDVAYAAANEMLFRKVTKPIEWWEDAVEFAKGCKQVNTAVYLPEYDSIDIDGSMTRNEACDFARILLEQGE